MIVLYEVNKVTENVQNLIKWIMECYTHACKIIICCEDDADILDCIKNRCELIYVDAPVTHEVNSIIHLCIARLLAFICVMVNYSIILM